MKPAIRTEPLEAEHAERLFPYLRDSDLYRYIPGPPPATAAALATEFRRLVAGGKDSSRVWLNWVSFDEQRPVGTLQATVFGGESAVIAYIVFRPFWGRSFGSQGCRWLLRELFERRGVRDVLAYVDERNLPSLRLLEAVGLSSRAPDGPADVDPGDLLLGLSVEEWRARGR